MEELKKSGMREKLDELVLQKKVPVLGICVGMQMLGNKSDEGQLNGLGWIDGDIKKFDTQYIKQKPQLPHMGWNDVYPTSDNKLFNGLEKDAIFYFLHSYYFSCNIIQDEIIKTKWCQFSKLRSRYCFIDTCSYIHLFVNGVDEVNRWQ